MQQEDFLPCMLWLLFSYLTVWSKLLGFCLIVRKFNLAVQSLKTTRLLSIKEYRIWFLQTQWSNMYSKGALSWKTFFTLYKVVNNNKIHYDDTRNPTLSAVRKYSFWNIFVDFCFWIQGVLCKMIGVVCFCFCCDQTFSPRLKMLPITRSRFNTVRLAERTHTGPLKMEFFDQTWGK